MAVLDNTYQLPNGRVRLSKDEISKVLNDFEYFMSHYQQIVNKGRETVPFKLNAPQRRLCAKLLPMIAKATRLNKRHDVVVCKTRQMGISSVIVAFVNYVCAYMEGLNHLNVVHTFPVGATITKFYQQKLQPLITGIHPDLFANLNYERVSNTSIITHYDNIKGAKRDNYYELVSANASSIRSGTCHIALLDEVGLYTNPERLEDALSPSIPAYGFSLVVYLSTFEEKSSAYFLNKIKTAMANPEDYTFIFMPWFELYPEQEFGRPLESVPLTDYDKTVIIPALEEWGVPESRWGDCIDWYHLESTRVSRMKQEYPTTIDEVLTYGSDEQYFDAQTLAKHRKNELEVKPYKFIIDGLTHKTEFVETDISPLKIFKHPFKGRRYMITIDPIASVSDSSDFFAAIVWDRTNNEQVARILGKDESLETWAEYVVELAKYYNQAILCPEQNIAQSLYLVVKGLGYHRWYFKDDNARKKQEPGLRTTVGTKDPMLQRFNLMLEHDRIILHDTDTFDQLDTFMRKVKGSNNSVKLEAKKGHHDDLVSCCWVYAGTLGQADITGNRGRTYAFL